MINLQYKHIITDQLGSRPKTQKPKVTPEANAALSHLELSWNLLEASGGQAGSEDRRRSGVWWAWKPWENAD